MWGMRTWLILLVVAAVLAPTVCLAQQPAVSDAQNKLLAKRAAEADAYRKLAEAIRGIQINSSTYVRDFVAESDDIRAALDGMIKGVRLGEPVYYQDGSCEVPAEVTVAKVVTTLREIHTRHYKGETIKATDFENITKTLKKDIIRVVGMGAPRPDLPPDLPAGVIEQLGGPPVPPQPPIPNLWLQLGPQARLMALRAARVDAQRRLVERIMGLRITSKTLVRDFVAESDVIRTEAKATLVGATEVDYFLHHDEPIAEVTLRVPVESVITTIKRLHTRHYKGDQVKGVDFEKIIRRVVKKNFEATGMGVAPPQAVAKYQQVMSVILPDWATTVIRATGEGVHEAIETAQGRLMAARAAELDAKRRLSEQVMGLQIDSQTTVRDFIAAHDRVGTQMNAVLIGSYVESTEITSDSAKVTVALPAAKVWSVVYQETRIRMR